MTFKLKLFFLTIPTLFMFAGCGSGDISYSSTNTSKGNAIKATFVDALVEGLRYTCSSGTNGLTSSAGELSCIEGDNVTFYLGQNTFYLPSFTNNQLITPYTLFPSSLDSALNFARLIQSIDEDQNLTNSVIKIDKNLENLLPADLDYNSAFFEMTVENALGIELQSAYDAQKRLNAFVEENGGTIVSQVLPVADAGEDQNVSLSNTAYLDGSSSVAEKYTWSFTSKPPGSSATMSDPSISKPSFIPDVLGTYILELTVNAGDINEISDTVTITAIIEPNYAPVISVSNSVNVNENQTDALTANATDPNGDSLSFYISGADSNAFNIDEATGVVTFISAPDYETKNSYSLTVGVTDSSLSDEQNVTINILDLPELSFPNDAPVLSVANSISVAENQTNVLQASATDENNDTLIFYVDGVDGSYFDINTSTGILTFKTAPDYEVKNSFSVVVGVTDTNLSDEQSVDINITDVLEKPVLKETTLSVDENQAIGTTVGSVTIVSHGDSVTNGFTLFGTNSGDFSIDSSGTLTTNASLDYETIQEYNLTVMATNVSGSSNVVSLNIAVGNVADIKPILVDTQLNVREDAQASDLVGKITIDTFGDSNITHKGLSGIGSSNFELALDGTITISDSADLDYETTKEYNLTALLTNSVGNSNTANVLISINDVIDEVASLSDFTGTVDENATAGTVVGNLNIIDPGDSNITKISLSGDGNSHFSITTDGIITVSSPRLVDFETKSSYALKAVATNATGDSNEANINITIANVAEVPKLENSTLSIMENKVTGAVVGSITIDDSSPDSGDSDIVDINLSGVGYENFVCDTDGEVRLSSTAEIDYETKSVYTLNAIATNTAGASDSATVTINIEDYDFDPQKIADLYASDADSDDNFGNSIAIDDDYILVGASLEDAGSLSDGGSAYLYKKDQNNSVTFLSKVTANAPKVEEYFGHSVAMENGVMVLGAPDNNSYGGVYIYTVDSNDSVSAPAQILEDTSGSVADGFGISVAISGDYVVVGAPGKAKAYLYKLDANRSASFVTNITSAGMSSADNFGVSVDIEGNYIVIGADKTDISYSDDGSAYVYQLNTTTDAVSSIGTITANTPSANDYFGKSVGVSGNYVVVGAYDSDEVATNSGNAYLYKIDSGNVSLVDTFAPQISGESLSANDSFGYNIGMDGEYIVLSAHKKDSGAVLDAGSVYLYHIDTDSDSVTYKKKIDSVSQSSSDYFGSSVTIDGDFIGIGSINDDTNATNSGKVFLYDGEPTDTTP